MEGFCGLVSNAFFRSINTPHANGSLSSAYRIILVRLIRAWFVECLFRKPNWKLERNLFLFRKVVSRICIIFSKNFTNVRKKRYGSIIVAVKLVTFLMNRKNIYHFKGIGEYSCCKKSKKKLIGMLFEPTPLFTFILSIKTLISFGVVGVRNILFSFMDRKYWGEIWIGLLASWLQP